MPRYNPATIEPRWQAYWEEHKTFAAPRMPVGEKLYVLDMFPYPSGSGLHVGHPEGYTATDIVCRYARMRGKSVMHPMGFDSFGLPAEEHAIQTGQHPRIQTEDNIDNFRRQLKMLGFSYDWDRELATTDVDYFRWTQWIFLQIFDTWFDHEQQKGRPISELPIPPGRVRSRGRTAVRRYQDEHRLAFQAEAPVNWCPALGTVLANEEVNSEGLKRTGKPSGDADARCANGCCGSPPTPTGWKTTSTRSTGRRASKSCSATGSDAARARTSTFLIEPSGRADDHRQVAGGERTKRLLGEARRRRVAGLHDAPRHAVRRDLHGDRAGASVRRAADHDGPRGRSQSLLRSGRPQERPGSHRPGQGKVGRLQRVVRHQSGQRPSEFPIWIADYVLISYGTGAIMAVPGHDLRDWEFAVEFRTADRSSRRDARRL